MKKRPKLRNFSKKNFKGLSKDFSKKIFSKVVHLTKKMISILTLFQKKNFRFFCRPQKWPRAPTFTPMHKVIRGFLGKCFWRLILKTWTWMTGSNKNVVKPGGRSHPRRLFRRTILYWASFQMVQIIRIRFITRFTIMTLIFIVDSMLGFVLPSPRNGTFDQFGTSIYSVAIFDSTVTNVRFFLFGFACLRVDWGWWKNG